MIFAINHGNFFEHLKKGLAQATEHDWEAEQNGEANTNACNIDEKIIFSIALRDDRTGFGAKRLIADKHGHDVEHSHASHSLSTAFQETIRSMQIQLAVVFTAIIMWKEAHCQGIHQHQGWQSNLKQMAIRWIRSGICRKRFEKNCL